jgi:hemolysin-activating ACP:hemolysin acyltransferase
MPTSGTTRALEIVTDLEPARALGLAVSSLMHTPVFSRHSFATVAVGLVNQINRKHYMLAMSEGEVLGFLGWGFVPEDKAEAWLQGADLRDQDCYAGDILVITAWSSESLEVTMAMLRCLREIGRNQKSVYFKRAYPDGRARPGRLSINAFIETHIRAAKRGAKDQSSPSLARLEA